MRALHERPASEANELKEVDLQNWLGVWDELRNWITRAA